MRRAEIPVAGGQGWIRGEGTSPLPSSSAALPGTGGLLPGRIWTLLDAGRVWEIALATLRPSSAVLPALVGCFPGVVRCFPGVVGCFLGVVDCFPGVVGTFLDAGTGVGGLTRHVVHAVTCVSVHVHAVADRTWYASLTRPACGRWHSACYRRRPGCCRLPCAVAGRLRHVSRVVYGVSAPVLHTFFSSTDVGRARRARFPARASVHRASTTR